MKIKRKIEMNLPQLIEWGFEKGSHGVQFKSDRGKRVGFRHMGDFWTEYEIDKNETFTVEVEEEITEDTQISKLAHYSVYGFRGTKNCTSINDVKSHDSLAFYIMNDDLTMTLIWTHEKGLVE